MQMRSGDDGHTLARGRGVPRTRPVAPEGREKFDIRLAHLPIIARLNLSVDDEGIRSRSILLTI